MAVDSKVIFAEMRRTLQHLEDLHAGKQANTNEFTDECGALMTLTFLLNAKVRTNGVSALDVFHAYLEKQKW